MIANTPAYTNVVPPYKETKINKKKEREIADYGVWERGG